VHEKENTIMGAIDIVKAGLAAVEQGDFKKVEEFAADDLVFEGPTPQPLGKREFVAMQMALHTAFPDWRFNATDFTEAGDVVTATVKITGTNTGELSLPMPGFVKVPPTGKKISLPPQKTSWTLKNGKLSRLDAAPSPTGGVPGILAQLGINLPG
jgi:predicted ester cyclase